MLKEMLKKSFVNIFSTSTSKISSKILNYDVISFDIFDTLIKRDVNNPTDVFELIEVKYNIKNYKNMRIKAEKIARDNSKSEEITLDEIYSNISLPKKEIEKLKQLEIQTEISICTKNRDIYEIYKKIIANNKKVYFTSDMYLSIEVIKEILKNNGYTKYDGIYLSSEEKVSKGSGNLFAKLLQDNNLSNKSIIHIGDSIKGDFINPHKYNIHSLLIKPQKTDKINNTIDGNILSSFIQNRKPKYLNYYQKFGYEIFGPILYSYTTWIHEKIKKDNIDKAYFLARDAKIIMDAYKMLYKKDIPIYYLYLSRKLVIYTKLSDVNSFKELYHIFNSIIKDTSTIKDILLFLNIDYKKYEKELSQLNIDINDVLMALNNDNREKLFNIIKSEIKLISNKQKECLKHYLKQNEFCGNVGLIDIGWNGTIQYYLNEISDANISGYYYGVYYGKNDKYNAIKRYGYLFDENNRNEDKDIVKLNVGLFELMFLSSEGSTLYLKEENGIIKPVTGRKDLSSNNIEKILDIQNMAKKFIEDAINSKDKYLLDKLDRKIYFENYKKIILSPTLNQIKLFKNFEFSNLSNDKLINNRSLLYYIIHPKRLYIDFRNSTCRVMFMKSLFKIKIPYYKILKKIYEMGDLS